MIAVLLPAMSFGELGATGQWRDAGTWKLCKYLLFRMYLHYGYIIQIYSGITSGRVLDGEAS